MMFKKIIFCLFLLSSVSQAKSLNLFNREELKCQKNNYSFENLYTLAKKGVVVITTPSGLGSGFVIKHDLNKTYIITNSHVVSKHKKVLVTWFDKKRSGAYLIKDGIDRRFENTEKVGDINFEKDLALLVVKQKKGSLLKFGKQEPPIGKEVISIGSPSGLDYSLTRGIVSGIRSKGNIIQTDAAINQGNSGGPLISINGCIVGVNTFKFAEKEGLNFALSAKAVTTFMENIPSQSFIEDKIKGENLSLKGLAEFYGRGININSDGNEMLNEYSNEILKSPGDYETFSFPRFLSKIYGQRLINRYSFAIAIDPSNYKYYLERGKIKSWLANWYTGLALANSKKANSQYVWMSNFREEAIEDLNEVIKLKPDLLAPYFYKAKYIYDFGTYGNNFKNDDFKRDENLSKLREKKETSDEDYFYKSISYKSHGRDYKRALKLINKAINLKENHLYYYQRAWLEEKLNKYNDALISIDRAISLDRNSELDKKKRDFKEQFGNSPSALKTINSMKGGNSLAYTKLKFNVLKKIDKRKAFELGKSEIDGSYEYGILKSHYPYIFPVTSLAKELNEIEWACKIYKKIYKTEKNNGNSTLISKARLIENKCLID